MKQSIGTNLYQDTRDFDNPSAWGWRWGYWHKTGEKFNGLAVMSTDDDWNGLGQTVQVKKGETYTYSVYARYKSGTGTSTIYYRVNGGQSTTDIGSKNVSLNETWQRVTGTFTVTADGLIIPRIERSTNNTNTLLIAGPKLEKGSVATDYVPYTDSSGIESRLGSVTYDDITFDDFEGLIPKPTTFTTTTSMTSTSTTTNYRDWETISVLF